MDVLTQPMSFNMDTKTLNEYLFADLVGTFANSARAERVEKLIESGTPPDDAHQETLIKDDFIKGLQRLEKYRTLALQARQESAADSPKS